MANVTMSVQDLFARRPATVGAMLTPLKGVQVPCQPYQTMFRGGKIIAAHDGGSPATTDFRKWRFRTVCRDVECQYYELWKFARNQKASQLEKAYLHLFKIDRRTRTEEEIVAVHAEPYHGEEGESAEYQRGLHLHVNKAAYPIPKSHFSLLISHIDDHVEQVLSSVDNFTHAFRTAATLIQVEVVSRYT